MKKIKIVLLGVLAYLGAYSQNNVVDFEELNLAPESYWNGSNGAGSFTNKFLTFYNDYDRNSFSWMGWAYTNQTDSLTNSYTNEFSSATGKGAENSSNYAVCYVGADWMGDFSPIPSVIKVDYPQDYPDNFGMYVCLSAWTNLYMEDNDFYASNNHWFKLHIKALKIGEETEEDVSREFFFADYSGSNSFKHKNWTYIDMSWARNRDSLLFTFSSSDAGEWGINTPTYFCMDNFGATPTTGIKENHFEGLQIFNNSEYCVISNSQYINKVEILDILGKTIKTKNINANSTEINISDLKQGIYLIRIYSEGKEITKKIIK
jgi:hypothetical protein